MYIKERCIRKIKGEDKIVDVFFGKGRFTSDIPQIREAKGYKVISSFGFSLAYDIGKDKTAFLPLVFWEKNAENITKLAEIVRKIQQENNLPETGMKGRKVCVFGRIEKSTYKTKSGEEREKEVLVVEGFDFDDYPRTNGNNGNNEGANNNTNDDNDGLEGIEEDDFDDIPF